MTPTHRGVPWNGRALSDFDGSQLRWHSEGSDGKEGRVTKGSSR